MYIKGGMKKLSKAIAKSAKENMDAEIKVCFSEHYFDVFNNLVVMKMDMLGTQVRHRNIPFLDGFK